jgi:hypothetical protein
MEVLQRTANRGSISTGYDIDNSCKFEADNTEYLERDPSSAGNRKTFTTSMWVKRTELGQASTLFGAYPTSGAGNTTVLQFGFTSDDKFQLGFQTFYVVQTNRVFRDTSAWYHIVLRIDTTQSTANDRLKLWINGVEETSFSTDGRASIGLNQDTGINFTEPHRIGVLLSNSWYFSGYMAEINHIDGSAKSPTDFGEYDADTGIWKPKAYTGSYGTNGFYLDFADASDLGDDESGNNNDFTENNITSADQATDTPTNNFCTLNPLHHYYNEVSRIVITEGGTKVTGAQASTLWRGVPSTFAVSKGKWYFEMETTNQYILIGTGSADTGQTEWAELTSIASPSTKAKMMYGYNGNIYGYNSSTDAWQYGFHFGFGDTDIVSVAVDLDNGHMYFRKNGAAWTDSGDPASGSTGTGAIDLPWYDTESTVFIVTVANSGNTSLLNFGGYTAGTISSAESDENGYGTFEYAPPSGYYALCGKNLAEYGGEA